MKVVIAGGGAVGTFIAGELHEAGHEVHLIEQDGDRVPACWRWASPRA